MFVRIIASIVVASGLVLFGIESSIDMSKLDKDQRDKLWQQVEQANRKSLPKTAAELLDQIYTSAMNDKSYPEAVKAISTKYTTLSRIHQPAQVYAIRQLSQDIDELPNEIRPVMKVILANWFFSYYQQNRWRFAQRSQTEQAPSDDFETWDLARLLGEIDRLFGEALKASEQLKQIPIADYDGLLEKGSVDDAHRPTLFDFIAFQALDFYSLDEQIIRKQGAFDVRAESPVSASIDGFLNWEIESEDDDSFLRRAILLYQEVIEFHQNDNVKTALIDADLHRLSFGNVVAVGSEKTARYQASLQRFAESHDDHPISSRALYQLASLAYGDEDLVKAHEIASQGEARFSSSVGGKLCFNLIQQIESKELQISTEKIWNGKESVIEVQYRNLQQVHFRLVEFDFENWRWGQYRNPSNLRNPMQSIAGMKVVKQWKADLEPTADYKLKTQTLPSDMDLASGCYLLIASTDDDFSKKSGLVSMTDVWVSNLAVVMRSKWGDLKVAGQVFDADSGEPVEGAAVNVSAWVRAGRDSSSVDMGNLKTDANGIFSIEGKQHSQHRIMVRDNDQLIGYIDTNHIYRSNRRNRRSESTIFFTDRSIYRPGQSVNFKGVCISSDPDEGAYKSLPQRAVQVALRDVNGEEIETRMFKTNEFGSFAGTFTAPRDRATGRMTLQVNRGPDGSASFRVEEYKRPKFFVEVEKADAEFKLNDEVQIKGTAKAYTGAPIDGAKVKWRVVRKVRYPEWWWWRCWWSPPSRGESQEIANGEAETEVDGSFVIKFQAVPDLSVAPESEPIFSFAIIADVTDTTGETRSAQQSVRLGYTSMQASLDSESWQTADQAVELKLETSTLDGEKIPASGTLKVYRLKPPEKVQRKSMASYNYRVGGRAPKDPDLSRIVSWPLGEVVSEMELATDETGVVKQDLELPAGAYKAVFEARDKAGKKVSAERPIEVVDLDSGQFAIKVPHFFRAKRESVEVGDQFVAVWGTGYDTGRAYVELENRGDVFRAFWTGKENTQAVIKMEVPENLRGGFNVHVTYIRENRAYTESTRVNVPWSNKKLQVKWEHFLSKLEPGGKETWTAIVSGPNAENRVAEMVATMYDASLDAYAQHNWPKQLGVFYQDYSQARYSFLNTSLRLRRIHYGFKVTNKSAVFRYRYFDPSVAPSILASRGVVTASPGGGGFGGGGREILGRGRPGKSSAFSFENGDSAVVVGAAMAPRAESLGDSSKDQLGIERTESEASVPDVDLTKVSARKNLNETAFFFPQLRVDEDGRVRIEFEVPEALTQWKFMGFAHDNELRTALLTDEIVTSKDLMVQPNPPRFLREGDVLEFSAKVTNQSATRQTGKIRLSFANAQDDSSMDEPLGNSENEQMFDVPAGQSKSVYWKLNVPDFVGALTYKIVGATQRLSDGEEGFLPVLSKRILVTESLPLPIRGNQTRQFDFDRLALAESSDSLVSQSYTVQMASNPSWYAVMALPYLMDYPHQCSEQVFNRLYANSLGQHIVNSDPKIKRVFDQWRGTDALDSPLEKNDDLRNVLIAESPWLRDAKDESQARRDVAILFDGNRLNEETRRSLNQLKQMQYSDGAWPWFPGGRANDYITLYVTTGFGRLRHLGVTTDVSPAIAALDRLDNWIYETHQRILEKGEPDKNHLTPSICMYLYGRSFFLKDRAVNKKYKASVDYFLGQAKKHWPALSNRQSQGHLAIGLKRFGDLQTPNEIMKSLTERSQDSDELGMYWQESNNSWWWYQAPIETQALMIEAYDEVLGDAAKAEECKIWLLKQKQTQSWKTTKATADAIYALLLRGTDLLASNQVVEVKLGGAAVKPAQVEAGTGFYQQRFLRGEIKPKMGQIEVTKRDDGIAWGSVHWQYLEDVGKIKPYEGTPLTLKKGLFIKKNTDRGPVIEPVNGEVEVGDQLVTRVEVRVDRDMEFVHLKDYRGSGTEPVNVLSQYKFQDGLSYYESTKDTASHFFIDYLPRGTYVFEYSVRVQHRGKFETGIAELQCMYAPEFNSHSASVEIEVK